MINRLRSEFVCVLMVLIGSSAFADGRILSDAEWLADIAIVEGTIRENHPRPFRTVPEEEFVLRYRALVDEVPNLSDKAIIVRLAELVGLIADGHTRLTIPREHPSIALEFGHTPTPAPEHETLKFKQLPLAFEVFEDGVFIIAASAKHASLIGHRVRAVDDTAVSEALEILQSVNFAENSQLHALMGADRLSLVEVLAAKDIARSAKSITLTLVAPDGTTLQQTVKPLSVEPVDWVDAFAGKPAPLRNRHPNTKFWKEHVNVGNYVFVQLDEIADADIPLAEFVVSAVEEALDQDAKLIIDLRQNFGGSGDLNKTLVMLIIQNNELNRYDRTFVLTGRRTFSAAQMLVNDLEKYTRVSFVGEPTGSRPDHYGDPKKIRLPNSGLTLRVSRLHWSSYTAFDDREATHPDFLVNWTSDAYFSGDDPALMRAISLSGISLKQLLRNALRRGDLQQIGRYALDAKLSPQTYDVDLSGVLLELGGEFAEQEEFQTAGLTYQVGLYLYPQHAALTAAAVKLENL